MAMLAEPRRKQRIGPNPRGKFFQEDEDNRGRQMLMKMGWKTGDGLGSSCQGMSEPIKPKVHTDARGLGYDMKKDPWVAHNEEFEQLLKNLNGSDATGNTVPATKVTSGDESSNSGNEGLEIKSKGSRSRIHYHKFVKNKDLSRASNKDMSCIFGKSLDETAAVFSALNSEAAIEDNANSKLDAKSSTDEASVEIPNDDDNVKSKKKKKKKQAEVEVMNEETEPVETAQEEATEESKVKKKRKKRSKQTEEEVQEEECVSMQTEQVETTQEEPTEELGIKIKKKKRSKKAEEGVQEEEAINEQTIQEEDTKETVVKKKKHRKEKADEQRNETEPISITEPVENVVFSEEPETKKKKKKRKDKQNEGVEDCNETQHDAPLNNCSSSLVNSTEPGFEEIIQKKKKKRKEKHNNEDAVEEDANTPQVSSNTVMDNDTACPKEVAKKKKSKKRKHLENEENDMTSVDHQSDVPSECEDTAVSKKKKKRKKEDDSVNVKQEPEEPPPKPSAEEDKVEKFGCLQFINRGSIVDYFANKMRSKGISMGAYV